MTDLIKAGLSTWALTWMMSFWHKTDVIRAAFGVQAVYDKQGYQIDREDQGGFGSWLNCPLCSAVLAFPFGWWWRDTLGPLGLALLLVRWWEGQRVKAEWWR